MTRHLRKKTFYVAGCFLFAGSALGMPASAAADPLVGLTMPAASEAAVQAYIQQHPRAFGGLYEDSRTHTLHVLTVGVSRSEVAKSDLTDKIRVATSRDSVNTSGSTVKVVTDPAKYSLRALNATKNLIGDTIGHRREVTFWAVDPKTDTVDVGVAQVTTEMKKLVAAKFGDKVTLTQEAPAHTAVKAERVDDPVIVVTREPHQGARQPGLAEPASANSRIVDSSPYVGGDRIVSQQTIGGKGYAITCTTNFDYALNSGRPGMGTAGHCGPTGTTWYAGYYSSADGLIHATGTMGNATTRVWGNERTDGELIDTTGNPQGFTPLIWASGSTLGYVGNVDTPHVGENICSDGSYTQQNCTGFIQQLDACVKLTEEVDGSVTTVCGLDRAVNNDGSTLVQSGDSGGPVYTPTSDKPDGIISGQSGPHTLYFSDINSVDPGLYGHPLPTP